MAIIKIDYFDNNSIKDAIKQIQQIEQKFQKNTKELFIVKCLLWIRDKANNYLSEIPMDGEVLSDIRAKWQIESISKTKKRLVNYSNKATFVEFGVGIVAEKNPHPQAVVEGYEYNKPSNSKHSDGKWTFNARDKQYAIDLKEGYFGIYQRENSGKIVAVTKGSPANLFLYNAGMDLLSSGIYRELWHQAVKETI